MFIDFNQAVSAGDLIVFPDWPFVQEPRAWVMEESVIPGSQTAGRASSIQGSADRDQ